MLARSERMDRTTFTKVFKRGSRIHTPGLTVVYTPAATRKGAVVVSKKVAKSAVARNRIRRQLYALLRTQLGLQGHVIILVKPVARTYTAARLADEAMQALRTVVGNMPRSR